jgi:hypothetical protein
VEVSCRSRRNCVAVGYHYSSTSLNNVVLAQQWNGHRWRIIQTRNPGGATSAFLNDVSCTGSSGCLAVGSQTRSGHSRALAEKWTGHRWRTLPVAQPRDRGATDLVGVSCVKGICMAVGESGNRATTATVLAQRWTGSAWRVLHAARPADGYSVLQEVSCPTISLCVAVGFSQGGSPRALTEVWRSGQWRLRQTRKRAPGILNGISCGGRHSCVAVGSNPDPAQGLSEAWNGTSWRVLSNPHPSGPPADLFNQVSCRTVHRCLAAGLRYDPNDTSRQATLAQAWNGVRWKVLKTPNP